jgi:hypothetical protein
MAQAFFRMTFVIFQVELLLRVLRENKYTPGIGNQKKEWKHYNIELLFAHNHLNLFNR